MSLYGDYVKEREGRQIIEDENGFATYVYCGPELKECYIIDIYVKPEMRKSKVASKYADQIAEQAKKDGCTHLSGSVDPRSKGSTDSLSVLLHYGFELAGVLNNLIWFKKELKDG